MSILNQRRAKNMVIPGTEGQNNLVLLRSYTTGDNKKVCAFVPRCKSAIVLVKGDVPEGFVQKEQFKGKPHFIIETFDLLQKVYTYRVSGREGNAEEELLNDTVVKCMGIGSVHFGTYPKNSNWKHRIKDMGFDKFQKAKIVSYGLEPTPEVLELETSKSKRKRKEKPVSEIAKLDLEPKKRGRKPILDEFGNKVKRDSNKAKKLHRKTAKELERQAYLDDTIPIFED